jgi:hypothetical protein
MVQNKENDIFTLVKITVLFTDTNTFTCNIDTTYNALKLAISGMSIYYKTEEEKKYYYLKFNTTYLSTSQLSITYLDLSTDSYIPEDFSISDMILTTAPSGITSTTSTISVVNPFINAVKMKGTVNMNIITNNSLNPGSSLSHIFGGMSSGSWTANSSLLSGFYIWTFSAE